MRRLSMVKRQVTPRVLTRRRQHEKKCSLEEDDERDDSMVAQASTPGTSLNSPKAERSNREEPAPETSRTASRDCPATGPAFSDDVLSSMTRTFDNRTVQSAEENMVQQLALFGQWLDWSIDPDSVLAFCWKAVVTVAVIYNCVIIILRAAFTEMRGQGVFVVLDVMADVIYVTDMVLESKTSFLQDGCLVKDARQTLQHYKEKHHFCMDVVSVLPLHSLLMHSALTSYEPLFRLNRVLKCHTMDTFFQRTESRTNNPNLLRAFKLSLHLGLAIHWIACLYYMLSEFEGLGSNDWVYPLEPNMTRFSRKYFVCMFWSTMTLTTIGERAPPVTDLEYIFTGSTFLVGVFVFAAVVGNVGDVISNLNAARRDFQARMDQIKFYMNHRNVPEHLQTRIKRWAEYTWDRTQAMDEPSALQFLPDRLRTEMAIHVHLDTLKKVPIFGECEEGLLRELVLKLRPQIFCPGDYICRIGEIGREMYIINHGQVEILIPDIQTGDPIQVLVMQAGNFFGEISLLKLDDGHNKRTADVRSVGFSELLCLSRRDLIVALADYPEAKQILEGYARQRFNNTRKLTPPETEDSRHVSPRVSCVSSHRQRTTRQVFAQVMRQEGFSKLLANVARSRELAEIRTAVEELKAMTNDQVEESIVCLQKKIQELERMNLDKNVELNKSQARVSHLEKILLKMSRSETRSETPLCLAANRDLATDLHTRDGNQVSAVAHGLPNDHPDRDSSRVLEEDVCYSAPGAGVCGES